jgi:multiple sugar transport system substrate-binding protein
MPADKYAVMSDALDWSTNVGYPGYSNAAVNETFNAWILNTMFARVATGTETAESALKQAETAMQAIWAKWKEKRLI